jgi:hypothetical protein
VQSNLINLSRFGPVLFALSLFAIDRCADKTKKTGEI